MQNRRSIFYLSDAEPSLSPLTLPKGTFWQKASANSSLRFQCLTQAGVRLQAAPQILIRQIAQPRITPSLPSCEPVHESFKLNSTFLSPGPHYRMSSCILLSPSAISTANHHSNQPHPSLFAVPSRTLNPPLRFPIGR